MPWDLFLIFFNKVIVGPMNNTLCLLKAKTRALKKKKKKKEMENAKRKTLDAGK